MTWRNEHLKWDWFGRKLPENIELGPDVYIESSYLFASFYSRLEPGLVMGAASGAYDLTCIATGPDARVDIGAFTCLNSTNVIAESAIKIGAHCLLAWGTVITDTLMPSPADVVQRRKRMSEMTGDPLRRLRPMAESKPVHIHDNVWIGFDSVVCGGLEIGRGAVIGCKTLITDSVPPYAIVVGNPSRLVRFLQPDDDDHVKRTALAAFGVCLGIAR